MITKSVPARAHTRTFAIGIDYVTAHTHQRAVAAAGVTFEDGVAYASAPEKAAWVEMRGVTSVETAALEMEAVAALSTRCRDPVYHLIIAYAKHERPTRQQVVSDAERLLKAIGMDDRQYILAAHKDTDDFHAHVIANRVGRDGRANDLWHERIIRERVCAEISSERGWDVVVGRHNRDIVQHVERLHDLPPRPQPRLSDGAYRRLREHGELPWQDVARPYVLDAVDRARDWSELHRRLTAHGVVVKLVRRGARVQGLAFAEGNDRTAPGCAASRIDARCSLSALERRFGSFTPSHETAPGGPPAPPWIDSIRPTILAAVDSARSWDDLTQRLGQHGVTMKLIERGGRVQGLAFARGSHADAPGCAASRIDARCKKAALEQRFGSFPEEPQRWHSRAGATAEQRRGRLRERAEHDARHSPDRVLQEAGHIVDQARMRLAYSAYRDRYFAERPRTTDARRNAAWERERSQRQIEAQRRREARRLLRAIARVGVRGLLFRHLAYWSVDAVIARRRAKEYAAGRVRWEATKIVLASERALAYKEKPMDYRSFVAESARAGDAGAQRVLDMLAGPARKQAPASPSCEPRRMNLREVRNRLDVIRAEQETRYERARTERSQLRRLAKPAALDDILAAERRRAAEQARDGARLTDAERARLAQFVEEKRSWNPLVRAASRKAEARLQAAYRSRCEEAIAEAVREFEEKAAPRIAERRAVDERQYRQYVAASFGLEAEMREARGTLRDRLPDAERRINILEQAGVSQVQLNDATPNPGLTQVATAIDQQYRALPESTRREAERSARDEKRNRSRESISFGGR
ncbi:MAG: relaxase/mobilization nuclease domain-containing protein [Candidatus Tumulicola sp.]